MLIVYALLDKLKQNRFPRNVKKKRFDAESGLLSMETQAWKRKTKTTKIELWSQFSKKIKIPFHILKISQMTICFASRPFYSSLQPPTSISFASGKRFNFEFPLPVRLATILPPSRVVSAYRRLKSMWVHWTCMKLGVQNFYPKKR